MAGEREYGEWLDPASTLGGSSDSDGVIDNYLTPFELGVAHIDDDHDHDCVDRGALEAVADRSHRRKRGTSPFSGPSGYTCNERSVLSLCTVEGAYGEPGTGVRFRWGEPGGESPGPQVEPHRQTGIAATVAPNPCVGQ